MLLRYINYGKRFEFTDKKTLIRPQSWQGAGHTATGTFVHVATCEGTAPKLLHEETGKEFIAHWMTYDRDVLPIF